MSEFKHNNNSGSLFKQDASEKKSESSPDFRGSCVIHEEEFYVSGWKKKGANGKDFISLSFTPKAVIEARKIVEQSDL